MSTTNDLSNLEHLKDQAIKGLQSCNTLEELESWRIAYLGRHGKLTLALRELGALPPEQRRSMGAVANELKNVLQEKMAQREQEIKEEAVSRLAELEQIDTTLPGVPVPLGRLHPTTRIVREICDAFVAMGFQIVEGPEVEWDRYNFEMLNIPKGHPARDMWNTIWVDHKDDKGETPMLLRTHTSPMQASGNFDGSVGFAVTLPGLGATSIPISVSGNWNATLPLNP